MRQYLLALLLFLTLTAIAHAQQQPINGGILKIIRKYLRTTNASEDDNVDVVRSLQTDHFFSKTLMPSQLEGQREKCWEKCQPGEKNMKEKLLGHLPHAAFRKNSRKSHRPRMRQQNGRKSQNPRAKRSKSKFTVHLRRSSQPMMLTAMLVPVPAVPSTPITRRLKKGSPNKAQPVISKTSRNGKKIRKSKEKDISTTSPPEKQQRKAKSRYKAYRKVLYPSQSARG